MGRRDFLVPAQPKPAGAAYQRVQRTLPPRAKPEYIGNPSPSESDPAAQSTLPRLHYHHHLLPLLYFVLRCLSAFYFYSPLAWPCLFLVTSLETEEATSNRPSSHPIPILTSPLLSQALSNACHSFKSPCRFFSRAIEPQLHCCTVVALVPPGLSYLRHPSSARPAPFVLPYPSPNARSPPHNPSRSLRAEWGLRLPSQPRPNNHHPASASDQRHLDTICGGRGRTKEGGTQGCGAETWGPATKIVRRPDQQKKVAQGRSDLFSPVQPQPTWQGRCRPSRLPSRGTGLLPKRQTFRLADRESSAAYQP